MHNAKFLQISFQINLNSNTKSYWRIHIPRRSYIIIIMKTIVYLVKNIFNFRPLWWSVIILKGTAREKIDLQNSKVSLLNELITITSASRKISKVDKFKELNVGRGYI